MGYLSALQMKNEPILCSLGYSNEFSGLCGALIFIGGIFGSIVLGYMFSYVRNTVREKESLLLVAYRHEPLTHT